MANEELLALSSVEMRRRIGTKEISPVELLEASLQRIKKINPAVNAVTAMCVDRARKEAKAAETAVRRGEDLPLLHGLPTGIKDLEETKGLLTTYGSPLYHDFVPAHDNVMVGRVRAAGAIVAGKTNVPEFGAGSNSRNPVWGASGNPFNPMLNPGGSSGGSAVASGAKKIRWVEICGSRNRSGYPGPSRASWSASTRASRASSRSAAAAPATSSRWGRVVITLASRNTSSETPRNVSPPVVRFGSSIGRRTIIESQSIRTRNQPDTTNSQTKPSCWSAAFAL